MCNSQKGLCERTCKIQSGGQEIGCDSRLMAKILIATIQVNLCCLLYISLGFGTKFTWIVIIKIFAINLPSQPFLGHHLGFHIFSQRPSWGLHNFFTIGLFLDYFSLCFVIVCCKSWHISINGCCYLSSCFLYTGMYAVLYMCTCIMHTFYLNFYIYIVRVNDCRLFMKQLNTCIQRYFCYQSSTEQLST